MKFPLKFPLKWKSRTIWIVGPMLLVTIGVVLYVVLKGDT